MTRVLIIGSAGRMGQTLCDLATKDPAYELAGAVDQGDSLTAHLEATDAIIEFAHHSVTSAVVSAALDNAKPLVIGTTGHDHAELEIVRDAAGAIPIVHAPNFAVAVNALFYLTRRAAEILGPDYDQEVVEMHHRMKVDAPSGTAKRLGEILAQVHEKSYDEVVRHGREGETGQRTAKEIGMHALRGGDVIGEHTVYFAGIGERLELTIRSSSRESYAAGALRAAAWAVDQKPGLYTMQDVLGLN